MQKENKIRQSAGDRAFSVVNYLLFAILTFICAYPFYYLIINSISANDLSANGFVNFLPKGIHLQNYLDVLNIGGIGTAALVSVARTVLGTICTVMASGYLGFMFTQQSMWHRKLWYRFLVVTMYFNAGLIPMFMTMKSLHLTNTFWVYIIPAIVQPYNIIMVKTYLYDFSGDLENCENLKKYEDAIAQCSALAEADGMWAVPSEVSNQSATSPCDAVEPTNAASLRWDVYKEIGYPEIGTMEDLLDVLGQMQEAAGTSDSGKQVYALSLFKDWDGDFMQNTDGLMGLYGYQNLGFSMVKADGSDVQGLLDEDDIYFRTLKFLFDANQAGLVDPESTIQNYDNVSTKYKDGQVLYSFWPWLGTSQYNTTDHTAEDKGFASVVIDDMECLEYGSMPYGKMSCAIMVGSQAQDPQRMVDFIDWLYSPEGINTANVLQSNTAGPEGLFQHQVLRTNN